MATKQQVFDLNKKHPEWTARQIAEALNTRPEYVHACGQRYGMKFARFVAPADENSITHLGWAAKRAGLTVAKIKAMAVSA